MSLQRRASTMVPSLAERCAANAKVRSSGVLGVPKAYAQRSRKRFHKSMNVALTEEQYGLLSALAERRGCVMADIMRAAIADYLSVKQGVK